MKVTIITTCYNRESTIRDTIESVLSQDYTDIEYILVDASSTDRTMDIVNEYKECISKIICEPDKGMYEGINKGLKIATGDIIGLLHSDDVFFSNNVISQVVHQFVENRMDLFYGNGLYVDSQNVKRVIRNWISGSYSKQKVGKGWLPLHTTVFITKNWLQQCGYYDESYKISADSDWLVRSLYDSNPIVCYFNHYIVKMRMGGLSTDRQRTCNKWTEDLRLYREHGINPYLALTGKILSKIPQFISAKFISQTTTE